MRKPNTNRLRIKGAQTGIVALGSLLLSATLLISCQSLPPSHTALGKFLNPPAVGQRIPAHVGSVVCFDERDALAMASTGFFTRTCESFSNQTGLIAESIEAREVQDGPVLLIRTRFRDQPAWVPLPWHDWA